MKRKLFIFSGKVLMGFALILLMNFRAVAQGGAAINTTGDPADSSAMLDVSSADKGVLIPRVALISTVDPIAGNKQSGLLVWNTSTGGTYAIPGFYFWNGTNWQLLGQGDDLGNHTATQNLDMSSNNIVNLNSPVDAGDAVNALTVQKSNLIFGAAAGTNNYIVSLSPAVTGYSVGMVINFMVTSANTAAVTLDVNGLGQKSVLKHGNIALVANDIKANQVVSVIFDGTNFQMVSQTGNAPTGGGGGTSDPTLIYTTDGF
jgi:hypothetical protein